MLTATLTGNDIAAVVAAVASLAAVVAVSLVMSRLVRGVQATNRALADFQAAVEPLVGDLTAAVAEAEHDLERVDDLVGSAEALASTVDSAARVGYFTVGRPVIKTVALAKGTSRAARRFRMPKAG